MSYHNCPYCNQLVPNDNPYCGKCGGPQIYKPQGSTVGFKLDPWIITATQAKSRFEGDDEAVRARTCQIQQEIQDALARGTLTRTDSYYYCYPWSPIYTVNRDGTIGSKFLRRGQQFTFDVSAEEIPEGGAFKREILIGDFRPTDKIDYCLLGEGGHDE